MKKVDSSLLCTEISSIALGYKALGIVTQSSLVRVLDASPIGARFLILAQGEAGALNESLTQLRTKLDAATIIDAEVFVNSSVAVKNALYALSQEPLNESLVVVECETVAGCLSVAHVLTREEGVTPLEIRILRSSTGGAYGFFTGNAAICAKAAEIARAHLKASKRVGKIEAIENPAPEFRKFFELTGSR